MIVISFDKSTGFEELGPVNVRDWTVVAKASREEEMKIEVRISKEIEEQLLSVGNLEVLAEKIGERYRSYIQGG